MARTKENTVAVEINGHTRRVKRFTLYVSAIAGTVALLITLTGIVVAAGDYRWVKVADLEPVNSKLEFMYERALKSDIADLDGSIQRIERIPYENRAPDQQRNLNVKRIERQELQLRLNKLRE